MTKFNPEELSRILSHAGEMQRYGHGGSGPGCLLQTAYVKAGPDWSSPFENSLVRWFDSRRNYADRMDPVSLLRALENRGAA